MTPGKKHFLAGVLLIFATYFYFLIFAQFAFLELARTTNNSEFHLHRMMASMALGGLSGSFIVPIMPRRKRAILLRLALLGASVSAFAAAAHVHSTLLSVCIGVFVGMITVGVATTLRSLFDTENWRWGAALGTGFAYFACNIPVIFESSVVAQAVAAAVVTLTAVLFVPNSLLTENAPVRDDQSRRTGSRSGFAQLVHVVLFFGILVWFDSAAFYIIQHSNIKDATWSGSAVLWRNAILHLSSALVVALCIKRVGFPKLLFASFLLLAVGSLAANDSDLRSLTGWTYPAGVSIYSACLVAFPAFGPLTKKRSDPAWIAAILYTFSGWICSGLGIGMAQNLHRVPLGFIAFAALVLVLPYLWKILSRSRKTELAYTAGGLGCAVLASLWLRPAAAKTQSRFEEGRAVYISEGCINCHSQYVRPGTADELLWGPFRPLAASTNVPPLIGNRRQGPDLLNVGNRRSRNWLELHFKAPRSLAPGTSMPSYQHLFNDDRGEALLDYLTSLKASSPRQSASWHTSNESSVSNFQSVGSRLFAEHCAVCHQRSVEIESRFQVKFKKTPPDLLQTNLTYAPASLPAEIRVEQIARIIKFGLPETDMPGHEYMPDHEIVALARFLEQQSALR